MASPDLWKRLRGAHLFRVLAVYLGASWLLLQVTSQLRDALRLPEWISPVTVILLLAGLVITVATAWVQSQPGVDARAAAEEVPDRWEVDLSEMAGAIAKGRMPHLTWGRALMAGGVGFLLVFGFAGLYVVIHDRGRSFTPEPAVAGEAAPGVAVLPFTVQGEGLGSWREGMISLLSPAVDGVGGLRAIDPRTVLARWRENVPEGHPADLSTSLAVARAAGARDAVLGSATSIGPEVRVSADVYDVTSGSKLGTAQVEGPPDSVLVLVDRLAVQVLAALPLEGDSVPDVDLARVTTSSVPALRAFLEGEAAYRRSDFQAAAEAYRRAVDADSTFAFAWYRLAFAYGWSESISSQAEREAAARADRFADRLPERERVLVRANRALDRGRLDGIETMKEAVQRYPDDVDAWYLLGELRQHLGRQALLPGAGREAADRAFARAAALDSSFSPAYLHPIDNAFARHDSAGALRLIQTYERYAGGTRWARVDRLTFGLLFGDSASRGRALSALDTADSRTLEMAFTNWHFTDPRAAEAEQRAFSRMRDRSDLPFTAALAHFLSLRRTGRVQAAAEALDLPSFPQGFSPVGAWMFLSRNGIPMPPKLRGWDTAPRPEQAPPVFDFFRGAMAAADGRWPEVEAGRQRLQRAARASRVGGDSASADFYEGAARGLAGYEAWKRQGRRDSALVELRAAQRAATGYQSRAATNNVLRWWTGRLLLKMKRPEEAARYFASDWDPVNGGDPFAALELGSIAAKLGENEKARAAYRWVLEAWKDADPTLQPRLDGAKRALEKLGG